jgi:hypothetical protein
MKKAICGICNKEFEDDGSSKFCFHCGTKFCSEECQLEAGLSFDYDGDVLMCKICGGAFDESDGFMLSFPNESKVEKRYDELYKKAHAEKLSMEETEELVDCYEQIFENINQKYYFIKDLQDTDNEECDNAVLKDQLLQMKMQRDFMEHQLQEAKRVVHKLKNPSLFKRILNRLFP